MDEVKNRQNFYLLKYHFTNPINIYMLPNMQIKTLEVFGNKIFQAG